MTRINVALQTGKTPGSQKWADRMPADNYVNYLLPGILLIAIANSIGYPSFRLFTDVHRGIFERFHSMPIARSAPLWGHVLTSLVSNAISVVVVILVALSMGFRSAAARPVSGGSGRHTWRAAGFNVLW
jgi:hypothetical protein